MPAVAIRPSPKGTTTGKSLHPTGDGPRGLAFNRFARGFHEIVKAKAQAGHAPGRHAVGNRWADLGARTARVGPAAQKSQGSAVAAPEIAGAAGAGPGRAGPAAALGAAAVARRPAIARHDPGQGSV